jgi:general secretion pathway protein A
MNLITPAIDAFLATGTCAVLISLLVIKIKSRNRKMKIRPKLNAHYAAIARQPGPSGLTQSSTNVLQHERDQSEPSALLSRNGINRVPPEKENNMERESFDNNLVASQNFQAAGFSSGTPLEANPFLQEAPQTFEAEQVLPLSMLASEVAEDVRVTSIEAQVEEQMIDTEVRAPEEIAEMVEMAESCQHEEETAAGHDSSQENREEEGAGVEVMTSALCLREAASHAGSVANVPSQDAFEPAAMMSASPEVAEVPEISEMPEMQTQPAVEENAKALENQKLEEEYVAAEPIAPEMLPVAAVETRSADPTMLSFHGLKQQPFDVTPDPSYLYFSPSHREALESISEGIENFRGFMTLVAEPGMGKTTLLNKLMENLSDTARVVFLFQTQCNSSELLAFILNELEVDHAGMDVVAMHRALNQVLLEEMLRGRRFVLIVDEGQNLQDSVLETIRLLSDFETAHSKLIQIVLAGQPQMVDTLLRPNLVQLRQRISVLSSLKSLSASETFAYIEHRLRAAGWNGQSIFTPQALKAIAELSGGVPRTINNLCFNALLKAFTRRQEIIDAEIIKEVSGKLHLEGLQRRPEPEKVAVAPTPAAQLDRSGTAQLARALTAALAAAARPAHEAEAGQKSKSNSGMVITGKLVEKISAQSWSKKHELRLDVSFEREPVPGVSVADRHYCCNFYVGEELAAGLQVGKPVRIRIEQD